MQTFLPFPDLSASAAVLDERRLGKQRVETLQILRALTCDGYGWADHPAVTMWRGHEPALVTYGLAVVGEWTARGHADTTAAQIAEFDHRDGPRDPADLRDAGLLPPWWGWEALHRSHRSALLRKDRGWYGPRLPADTPDDLDYVWPDPPTGPAESAELTAWVVRGRVEPHAVVVQPPPARQPVRRGTKRERQLERLRSTIAPGDLVVVPAGDELAVARVLGPDEAVDGAHRRQVAWLGRVARHTLARPAALQDPQFVFPLRGEPAVTAVANGRDRS